MNNTDIHNQSSEKSKRTLTKQLQSSGQIERQSGSDPVGDDILGVGLRQVVQHHHCAVALPGAGVARAVRPAPDRVEKHAGRLLGWLGHTLPLLFSEDGATVLAGGADDGADKQKLPL